MGVVYKAHDTKLDRVVALKFLPHYLTSDPTEKERFYHEARAAATLSHPNITTIHEIDEHDNQVYIAMEFVEGKTLEQVIESDIPSLKKILDIAIQACDGLAAAAEKELTHRDIKSDNIMLTPKGQVKIMDFGLAKLKGATKLTKEGSTLGTAAYMSPEQAMGEEVDNRSDIFSFGVVLYELLTSKLPFRGEHQAALAYSIMNEEPPPITRFNQTVTPEIERIVSKALAKDREDRYQHIDDMLADLRREKKNIEYARTGYVRTPVTPQATEAPPVEVSKPKRNLLKLVVPASVFVILALLFFIFNPWKIKVSQDQTAEASGNSLAVMYFQNIPDPEDKDHTSDMLADLLITALSQTRGLEVISRERLYDIQKELGQADAKTLSPSLVTQVAKKAGVKTMLLGSILQKQPKLAVTTRIIDVQSGKILSSQRLTSFSAEQIFGLVDSLALLVRNDMNITTTTPTETKSVAEVTTKSPEAYRSYIEGTELAKKFYNSEAKAALERAVELDNEFAMAYFALAGVDGMLGDIASSRAALQKAVELSNKVAEKERLRILAAKYQSENNPRKAADVLEKLLEKYPHEVDAYNQLSVVYFALTEYEKRAQTLRRGLKIDPSDKNLWNSLGYVSAALNRREEALETMRQYLTLAPAEPNPYDSRGDIHNYFGERDSSRIWYQKANALHTSYFSAAKLGFDAIVRRDYASAEKYLQQYGLTSDKVQKAFSELDLALIAAHRGQIKKAREELLKILASHKSQNIQAAINFNYLALTHLAYESDNYPAMLEYAKAASLELKKDPQDIIYGRDLVAWAWLKNGNSKMAYKILDEIKNDLTGKFPPAERRYHYAAAMAAYEEGKYKLAMEKFQEALHLLPPNIDPLLPYAISLLKGGETEKAINELNRLTNWYPTVGGYVPLPSSPSAAWYWPISSVKARYWLGVAYEQRGEKEKAIKEYETFLDIWKDADFSSPELKDAKARVSKLKGMAAK